MSLTGNLFVAGEGTASINATNSNIIADGTVFLSDDTTSTATLNLTDSTLAATQVIKGNGTLNLNLNRATLRANGNSTDFLQNLGTISINTSNTTGSSPALTFDTQSNTVTLTNNLATIGTGNSTTAFLKTGNGTLSLTGNSDLSTLATSDFSALNFASLLNTGTITINITALPPSLLESYTLLTLASNPASLTLSNFSLAGIPTGLHLAFNNNILTLQSIPEPATLTLILGISALLLTITRRPSRKK